jgi:hypothetical protein
MLSGLKKEEEKKSEGKWQDKQQEDVLCLPFSRCCPMKQPVHLGEGAKHEPHQHFRVLTVLSIWKSRA